ncbi:MAG: hypothetical protein WD993_09925 [Thermoleophilaceae bacterium]
MAKRLIVMLAALALLGFAAAGCGGDDEDGGGNGAAGTAADTVTDETATDETVTEGTDTDGGGVTAPGSREEAAEQCRQGLEAVPQLSDAAKDEVGEFCDTIASGDEDEIRDSARDVCRTVVEDTVPEGTPGREAALDACTRSLEQQQR